MSLPWNVPKCHRFKKKQPWDHLGDFSNTVHHSKIQIIYCFFHGNPKGNWNHCYRIEARQKCSYSLFWEWKQDFIQPVKACRHDITYLCKVFMKNGYFCRASHFSIVAAGVFFFANICPSRETHIVFASPNGYCYFGKDNSKLSLTRELKINNITTRFAFEFSRQNGENCTCT